MAGNLMISVCVRLRHIYSHKSDLYQGWSFEADWRHDFSWSFFGQNKDRFRGHPKIICCYTQEVFFSERYYLFKFFCRFLSVPLVPVSTSTEFISNRFIRKTRETTIFAPFKSRLTFKRQFHSKTCIKMGIGNLTQVCLVRVDLLY